MTPPHPSLGEMRLPLEEALRGSRQALGDVLEACRPYLLRIALEAIPPDLRAKVGASDLVQETFVDAQRGLDGFHGRDEGELLAWLRQILAHNLMDLVRRYREAGTREVGREVPLDARAVLVAPQTSPSGLAVHREEAEALARALERLPQPYRQVIAWKHQEGLCYEEIGRRLGRSPEAARKLWFRAVEKLTHELSSAPPR